MTQNTQSGQTGGQSSGQFDINSLNETSLSQMSKSDVQGLSHQEREKISEKFGQDWESQVGQASKRTPEGA